MLSDEHEIAVRRRLEFLLDEAKQKSPVADQVIKIILRVVSSYYSVGRDARSTYLYRHCPYRSAKAHKLLGDNPNTDKMKEVTNEHQEELGLIWKWVRENSASLTLDDISRRLKQWPIVVITKEEEKELRKKWKTEKPRDPCHRYEAIGITVLERSTTGWIKRKERTSI